ncbi:hypothetical protein [Mycobacterium tuberculosis]|uniref:hypothetical protein n=1 Tax=Mycobacterium tuberculosis TaxID=1773 RepID=UPI00272B7B50|nr:hypothetical protein [Mycobacterium tuberculosis]
MKVLPQLKVEQAFELSDASAEAIKAGLLTVEKKGKKNIFSGRILEIEGLATTESPARVTPVSNAPSRPMHCMPHQARAGGAPGPGVWRY